MSTVVERPRRRLDDRLSRFESYQTPNCTKCSSDECVLECATASLGTKSCTTTETSLIGMKTSLWMKATLWVKATLRMESSLVRRRMKSALVSLRMIAAILSH